MTTFIEAGVEKLLSTLSSNGYDLPWPILAAVLMIIVAGICLAAGAISGGLDCLPQQVKEKKKE